MGRLSLKRCSLYLFCLTGMLVILINIRQKDIWPTIRTYPVSPQAPRVVVEHKGIPELKRRPYGTTTDARISLPRSYVGSPFNHLIFTSPVYPPRVHEDLKWKSPPVVNITTVVTDPPVDILDPSRRPWYMKGGTRRPHPALKSRRTSRRIARLWPEEDAYDDRVTNQLMFVPPDYDKIKKGIRYKKIMVPSSMDSVPVGPGQFIQQKCPVNTCTITRENADDVDLVIFKDYVGSSGRRPRNQVWMLYFLECPYHTQSIKNALINWTATYRHDSDIVAPYERWQYYDPSVIQIPQTVNYAANKTKKVAWFVSNCHARNQRMQYAKELSEYIQVDIYGGCGTLRCPRSQAQSCFEMLDSEYKFYLAFENSNCRDYITEKLYVNGLGHNVLPIVMGAHQSDYARSAPYRSYIHVDEFASPKELAGYLHRLDKDDELYNSYFRWKGTGEFINTFFWCRVCAMLHDDVPSKTYKDINEWWRGDGICTNGSWREHDQITVAKNTWKGSDT